MIDMWLVRDKDGCLFLFFGQKPYKLGNMWYSPEHRFFIMLRKSSCPEVQWTDEEPTKVKLVIEK